MKVCNISAKHSSPCGPDCLIFDYFGNEKQAEVPRIEPPGVQQHFLVAIRHSEMPVPQQWQFVMEWAEEWQSKLDRLRAALELIAQGEPNGKWAAEVAREAIAEAEGRADQ